MCRIEDDVIDLNFKGEVHRWPFCPIYFKRGGIPSVFQVQFQYLLWNYLYILSMVLKNFMYDCAHKTHKPYAFQKFCCFSQKSVFFRYFAPKSVFNDNAHVLVTLVYVVSYYKNNQYLHTGGTKFFWFQKKVPQNYPQNSTIFQKTIKNSV